MKENFMAASPEPSFWFAGAYWNDHDPVDQTARFLREGVWENGFEDKLLDEVRAIRPGDRIAIKATTNQKKSLPFDAHGKTISIMRIKATGTVISNDDDGRRVRVRWDPTPTGERIWYFYTYQGTLWRPKAHVEEAKRLIAFAFQNVPQDFEWFRQRGYPQAANGSGSNATPSSIAPHALTADDKAEPGTEPYGIDDLAADGVFVATNELAKVLKRWESKKNLILQGPPGVGKTFIARKLAYALIGSRDPGRIGSVQFHQSYAYDDFVRGYRPKPSGGFEIRDGVFYEFCRRAAADQERWWVFIIDELNRGNIAQIFGELLMLIEDDKRKKEFEVPLVYRHDESERFYVPPNVYVLGLMNVADRSLALVDYALRRRFSFFTLTPLFDSSLFQDWLRARSMQNALVTTIVERMISLNETIRADSLLGSQYQIGHSFFCPKGDDFTDLTRSWYDEIVETEIVPLLAEYWIDNPDKVTEARRNLLAR